MNSHYDVIVVGAGSMGMTKNIVGQIVNKDIDCAFVADFGHHPKIDKLEILMETLVLVSNAPKITAADLKEKPMPVFKEGCSYRAKLEEWLLDAGIEKKESRNSGSWKRYSAA